MSAAVLGPGSGRAGVRRRVLPGFGPSAIPSDAPPTDVVPTPTPADALPTDAGPTDSLPTESPGASDDYSGWAETPSPAWP